MTRNPERRWHFLCLWWPCQRNCSNSVFESMGLANHAFHQVHKCHIMLPNGPCRIYNRTYLTLVWNKVDVVITVVQVTNEDVSLSPVHSILTSNRQNSIPVMPIYHKSHLEILLEDSAPRNLPKRLLLYNSSETHNGAIFHCCDFARGVKMMKR